MKLLKKIDKNLERWVMFLLLAGMTLVLGIQIFCRFLFVDMLEDIRKHVQIQDSADFSSL